MAESSNTAEVILQCLLDSPDDPNRNPNCDCLLSGGGPDMNTDISGIGVRISFYLQALFLALLSARSGSLDEIAGALYTLIATNIAMAVTSLILGFKPSPEISFHDAIVVFYLLSLSWASVFSSLPSYNRFKRGDATLKYFAIVQSYILFAFALAIIIKAPTFGATPLCNENAQAVIFRPFSALRGGRITAGVVLSVVIITYTWLTYSDYAPQVKKRWREKKKVFVEKYKAWRKENTEGTTRNSRWLRKGSPPFSLFPLKNKRQEGTQEQPIREPRDIDRGLGEAELGQMTIVTAMNRDRDQDNRPPPDSSDYSEKFDEKPKANKKKTKGKKTTRTNDPNNHMYDTGISGHIVIEIFVIFVMWSLAVMNTELLIQWNHFNDGGGGGSAWQFGQILPMFLVVLPLVNMVKAFIKYKLSKRQHRRRVHKKHTRTTDHGPHAHPSRPDMFGNGRAYPMGGMGGGFNGFGGGFGSRMWSTGRPDGTMPSARISEHSVHSEHPRPSSRTSNSSPNASSASVSPVSPANEDDDN